MSTPNRDRKITPVKVSESVIKKSELQQITLEHKYISSILRDSEKWLRIAEIRNPDIDRANLLEELVSRKKELSSRINVLREEFRISPSFPSINVKHSLPFEWDFERFPPDDPRDPRFHAAVEFVRYLEELTKWDRRIYVLDTECAPQSGLITMAGDFEYLDIFEPSFSTTDRDKNFTVLETGDYFGVSFANMYIDVSDAQIEIYDSFHVATILKFEFPPAPCDGVLYFHLRGQLALSPDIDGDSGIIRVQQKYRFNIEGDGFDPTNLESYWPNNSIGTTTPGFEGTIRRDIELDFRNVGYWVSNGQKGILRIALSVLMGVGGGRSSFSQNGEDPLGYMIVITPPGGTDPGVSYNFEPRE